MVSLGERIYQLVYQIYQKMLLCDAVIVRKHKAP